jgi:hypothetical protein
MHLVLILPADRIPLDHHFQGSEQGGDMGNDVILQLVRQPISIASESDGSLPFAA